MKSILLTKDSDIINGLRLAGVEGVLCNNKKELVKNFDKYKKDPDIGIIILTRDAFEVIKDEVIEVKLSQKTPLVVTIPELGGKMEDDFILKYVKESVGIKAV